MGGRRGERGRGSEGGAGAGEQADKPIIELHVRHLQHSVTCSDGGHGARRVNVAHTNHSRCPSQTQHCSSKTKFSRHKKRRASCETHSIFREAVRSSRRRSRFRYAGVDQGRTAAAAAAADAAAANAAAADAATANAATAASAAFGASFGCEQISEGTVAVTKQGMRGEGEGEGGGGVSDQERLHTSLMQQAAEIKAPRRFSPQPSRFRQASNAPDKLFPN